MPSDPKREQALFQTAAQLAGAERAAFLKGACHGDPTLRARLESLLAASTKSDGLPTATETVDRSTARLEPRQAEDEGIGRRISHYKLLQKLGEGGCGVVYMADQEEPVRRRVALKVIKLGMDTRSVVARFEAERQALAMMDHPNIARVLDAGATDKGRPYFVMELVRGVRITDYCDQNHLPTGKRLELFISVCQAVQHAHQKGIIHRDLKPSNILVTLHDGVPVPKVIDFGIAKAIEQKLTDKTLFTELNQFIGTPAYMSPEQAELSGLDIDTRSDIYSLGVLLYELLTGRTPFDARELVKEGLEAIRRTIREVDPPRPSTRLSTLTHADLDTVAKARGTGSMELRSQLQGDLDWIVMKALEKDRTRRYETANGFAMDVRRHLADEPVTAGAPSAGYKFRKFVRRNKVAFAVAATIALVLVVATGISVWQAVRATRAEALAKQRLTESEAITKFLNGVFQSPDPALDGRTITVAETLNRAVTNLDRDLAAQPSRRAQLQYTLGSTYFALGLAGQAIPLQEKARDYRRAAFGPEHPDTLHAMSTLASSYSQVGRRGEALKLQEEVLAMRRKVLGPQHLDTLSAMMSVAICYVDAGRRDEAIKLLEGALPVLRKVVGPEHPKTILALGNLAYAYGEAERWTEALKLREEVLALSRKVNGPDHPDTLWAMASLANSYQDAGRWDEALKLREDHLALSRKVNGPDHPDTIIAMMHLGISYHHAHRTEEALRLRQEMLETRRRVNGPEHLMTLRAMISLSMSHREAGHTEEAIRLGQTGLELFRRVMGGTNLYTLNAMTELAMSYEAAQRIEEATTLEEKSLALKRQHLAPGDPFTVESMEHLATCYEKAGRPGDAQPLRKEVAEIQDRIAEKRRLENAAAAGSAKH
jgi:serine/threonine protein kinase/tetratricopeptide (TPR) repeat protein